MTVATQTGYLVVREDTVFCSTAICNRPITATQVAFLFGSRLLVKEQLTLLGLLKQLPLCISAAWRVEKQQQHKCSSRSCPAPQKAALCSHLVSAWRSTDVKAPSTQCLMR
jgi:hypothetical protein